MTIDFPADELKPLAMIMAALEKGIYECLGLINNSNIEGYVFLIKLDDDYLIDYLAIYQGVRNKGLGSKMLALLNEHLSNANSIIGEVENPDFAKDTGEQELRSRRYGFYMRNGFRDTGVTASCFGVAFIIIETGPGLIHTKEEITSLYRKHYKTLLPEKLYNQNIII